MKKDGTTEDASTFNYQNVKLDKSLKKSQPSEIISETILGNNTDKEKNENFLDPNLTLHSPIAHPGQVHHAQESCSGNERKNFNFENSNITVGCHNVTISITFSRARYGGLKMFPVTAFGLT